MEDSQALHGMIGFGSRELPERETTSRGGAQAQPGRPIAVRAGAKLGSQQRHRAGGFYRRMAARRGGLIANIATARKLGVLIWQAMVKGLDYVDEGLKRYETRVLETKQRALRRLAKDLGLEVAAPQKRAA